MVAKVFISHTDEDIERCAGLLKVLGAWQVPCYFDAVDRRSAQGLAPESQQALVDCDVMLRVCTRFTNRSYWMSIEAGALLALQADDYRAGQPDRHTIINLILDKGYTPEPFDVSATRVDATTSGQPGWVNDLRRALGLPTMQDTAPAARQINPPPARRLGRRAVVGLGVAGAAVVAAGAVGGIALARRGAASRPPSAPPSTDPRLRWWASVRDDSMASASFGVVTGGLVVDGATLYIATTQAHTFAFSLNGQKLWQFNLPSSASILQRPVAANGVLYVSGHGEGVYAIQNGAQLWFYAGAGINATQLTLANGRLFGNAIQQFSGVITALDLMTGKDLLDIGTQNGAVLVSGVAVSGTLLYSGGQDGYLYALDMANIGAPPRWRAETGAARDTKEGQSIGYYVSSLPVVADGLVYAGSQDFNVYAVDTATGARRWQFQTGDRIDEQDPALANGMLYVSSNDKTLYALDSATGKPRWKHQTGSAMLSAPTVAGGVVYVGSGDHAIYALDAQSGALRHTYSVAGPVRAQPTAAGSTLFAADTSGVLYAFAAE